MIRASTLILVLSLWVVIQCSPWDDGKYKPEKHQFTYNIYDDGKYYRPLDEGKYIPGDEGRYTYIYQQGLYPTDDGDYRYVHQVGPDGGFGGNGGVGGYGGNGGEGGNGGYGPNGPGGPGGSFGPEGPFGPDGPFFNRPNSYTGTRIYANRYPYIHKVIKGLVDKYVSSDGLHFGDEYEGSVNHYRKVYADKEIAVKCKYLTPNFKVNDTTEFVTQYPPTLNVPDGEKYGSYYSFRGTKILNTVANSLKNKLKLEYEVFVRIVDEVPTS